MRCGGFDHEYHSFWATFKREHAAEAARKGTLGTDTLLRNDKPNNEASTADGNQKSPSSITFIFDTPSIGDSLSLSGGTDEALHPSNPSRPTPEVTETEKAYLSL